MNNNEHIIIRGIKKYSNCPSDQVIFSKIKISPAAQTIGLQMLLSTCFNDFICSVEEGCRVFFIWVGFGSA